MAYWLMKSEPDALNASAVSKADHVEGLRGMSAEKAAHLVGLIELVEHLG